MMRLALVVSAVAAAIQSGKAEEKPKLPPFTVVITALTAGVADKEMQAFKKGLEGLKGYADLVSRIPSPPQPKGENFEDWTFRIPGELKFDPTPLWQAFINVRCRKYRLTLTGALSQEAQTKKLFITSYSGKSKVKLMNRPKNSFDDPDAKPADHVAKLSGLLEEGKLHFTVTGEIFSHGGTLAVLVESYEKAAPPPKPKEEKK